jgi:hypothetical protein
MTGIGGAPKAPDAFQRALITNPFGYSKGCFIDPMKHIDKHVFLDFSNTLMAEKTEDTSEESGKSGEMWSDWRTI